MFEKAKLKIYNPSGTESISVELDKDLRIDDIIDVLKYYGFISYGACYALFFGLTSNEHTERVCLFGQDTLGLYSYMAKDSYVDTRVYAVPNDMLINKSNIKKLNITVRTNVASTKLELFPNYSAKWIIDELINLDILHKVVHPLNIYYLYEVGTNKIIAEYDTLEKLKITDGATLALEGRDCLCCSSAFIINSLFDEQGNPRSFRIKNWR